jgi:hypothetical protein
MAESLLNEFCMGSFLKSSSRETISLYKLSSGKPQKIISTRQFID